MNAFARADGFNNYAAMWLWFSARYETNSFTGYIIRWRLSAVSSPRKPNDEAEI